MFSLLPGAQKIAIAIFFAYMYSYCFTLVILQRSVSFICEHLGLNVHSPFQRSENCLSQFPSLIYTLVLNYLILQRSALIMLVTLSIASFRSSFTAR